MDILQLGDLEMFAHLHYLAAGAKHTVIPPHLTNNLLQRVMPPLHIAALLEHENNLGLIQNWLRDAGPGQCELALTFDRKKY